MVRSAIWLVPGSTPGIMNSVFQPLSKLVLMSFASILPKDSVNGRHGPRDP